MHILWPLPTPFCKLKYRANAGSIGQGKLSDKECKIIFKCLKSEGGKKPKGRNQV